MPTTDIQTKQRVKNKIKTPNKWEVIIINDDVTPMDFVVNILVEIFNHNLDRAEDLMIEVHESGSAVVGVYNFEIAETKAVEATNLARSENFPLQIKIKEES